MPDDAPAAPQSEPSEPSEPVSPEPPAESMPVISASIPEAQPPIIPESTPVEITSPEVKFVAQPPAPTPSITNTASIPIIDAAARARAYASVVQRREKSLARIVEYVQKEGKITNAQIVRLLRVSEATATRYAHTLVSRGQLKKEGRGRSSSYFQAIL